MAFPTEQEPSSMSMGTTIKANGLTVRRREKENSTTFSYAMCIMVSGNMM
jgi:hypothetical protein